MQAAILNLLVELQAEKRVAYLFISHDLGVVRYISDRIAVLYLGRVQELGPADVVFDGPHHPYTEALLSAVPTIDGGGRERIRLEGDIPSAASPPSGCVFHTRCPRKLGAICEETEPPLVEVEDGHHMRCHIPIEELRRLQAESDGDGMKIRGVVLEQTGGPLTVVGARARATRDRRRCSSGSGRAASATPTGTPSTARRRRACPAVLGHEGAGVVEADRRRSDARRRRRPRRALVGAVVRRRATECRRDLPQLCSTVWPAMGTGGLMDGTPRLSRDGEPVFHYSFLSTFAEACVVPERSCIPIPDDVPFDVAALVGCAVTTGRRRGLADGGSTGQAIASRSSVAAASACRR